jgi:Domain of unknown function (DUF5916)
VALAVMTLAGAAAAQAPEEVARPTVRAVRLAAGEAIVLDGRLDEAVWRRAQPARDFIQQDPANGQPATEPTEVRIAYDARTLYMGVTCFDDEPDKWLGYQRRRDEFLQADDRFMWTIDTYLDGRSAYYFEMNPSGLMGDALQNGSTNNRQWDGIWNARVRRSDIGWTLEIAIPFRTLNFNPDLDAWGINFQRTVRRKNEESLWTGWARNQGLRRMTNAGLLVGIHDVSQGHGLDVKPYVLATLQSAPGRPGATVSNEATGGVDLFYNPVPSLRATFTTNTDFAQTEVDQRQVNLTRYSLFFPEKRDFFLDGSTFFDFASGDGSGSEPTPFFSRRIGLDAAGAPQPINFGSKLTGQLGAQDVGLLQVQTRDEGATAGENFLVARVKRRLLRQSYVGGIYTLRDPRDASSPSRRTSGVDAVLATSAFMGQQNLSLAGYFLHTSDPVGPGGHAQGLELSFPNDPWSGDLKYRDIQRTYDAAVGFASRVGFRRFNPSVSYSPRPRASRYIRRFSFGGNLDWLVGSDDGRTLTRDLDLEALQVDLHSQDSLQIHVLPSYERLERPFAIAPGITLPAGASYQFTRYRVQASTANRRVISVAPTVEWGRFYSGTRLQLATDLNIRARPGLIVYLSGEWNRVALAEGRFETRLVRAVLETQFSPWVSLVNNVQYDTQSAVLGWQSRFRWILTPGDDVYVVYTQNWLDDSVTGRFSTLDRRAASKLLYTHRF